MGSWFASVFEKFAEFTPALWITIAALVALGVALLLFVPKVKWDTRMLAMGAICLALSFVLSYVRLYHLPQAGSVTLLSMLPVMLYAYVYGFGPGLIVGICFGALQFFQDPYFVAVPQVLLDYILAFAALSLSGLFSKWKSVWAIPVSFAVAVLGRVFFHTLAGVIYFTEYAEGSGHGPLVYSLLYNLSSAGLDGLLCVVVACVPAVQRLADVLRPREKTGNAKLAA